MTIATLRAALTHLETRKYADHTIELYRDDADYREARWRRHEVIIDGVALSFGNEDFAIEHINDCIEAWDEETAAA